MDAKNPGILAVLSSLILAVSVVISGAYIAHGLIKFRSYERYVSVKGLAMRDVEADLVVWPIKHSVTGSNLATVQQTIAQNSAKIISFLKLNGLQEGDIVDRKLEVTDLMAQSYRQQNVGEERFIVSEVITVRTITIDTVQKALQNLGQLLQHNVSLVSEQGQSGVEYIYTRLNDIKPEMIAEATKNARESAEQFAKDSGAKVGDIQYASQGVFQILPRDSENGYMERQQRYKTVRVVSTIQFYIED